MPLARFIKETFSKDHKNLFHFCKKTRKNVTIGMEFFFPYLYIYIYIYIYILRIMVVPNYAKIIKHPAGENKIDEKS